MGKLYRVYDAKAEIFGRIFEERTDASARRAFASSVADHKTEHGMFPEDYSLFRVGSADENSGQVTPEKAPVQVCTALQCVHDDGAPLAEAMEREELSVAARSAQINAAIRGGN